MHITPLIQPRHRTSHQGVFAFALVASLVTACGGGSDNATASVQAAPNITALQVDRMSYGRTATFTIVGTGLTPAVTFTATGCDGVAWQAGATANSMAVTCVPHAQSIQATAKSGDAMAQNTYTVQTPLVTLGTTLGEVVVELNPWKTPATVDNFLAYVNSGFYDGTIFHRVIAGFVNQGGGFNPGETDGTVTLKAGLRAAIPLETNKGLSNLRGTIAMARATGPDTAQAQFFFNVADNGDALDYIDARNPGYAVFGKVVSGQPVLDTLNTVPTRVVVDLPAVPVTKVVVTRAVQTR